MDLCFSQLVSFFLYTLEHVYITLAQIPQHERAGGHVCSRLCTESLSLSRLNFTGSIVILSRPRACPLFLLFFFARHARFIPFYIKLPNRIYLKIEEFHRYTSVIKLRHIANSLYQRDIHPDEREKKERKESRELSAIYGDQ